MQTEIEMLKLTCDCGSRYAQYVATGGGDRPKCYICHNYYVIRKEKFILKEELQAEIKKQKELSICIKCNKIASHICIPCKLVEVDEALKRQAKEIFNNID